MRIPTKYEVQQMEKERVQDKRYIFGTCTGIILVAISLILIG